VTLLLALLVLACPWCVWAALARLDRMPPTDLTTQLALDRLDDYERRHR
jgi:hypothetical protein